MIIKLYPNSTSLSITYLVENIIYASLILNLFIHELKSDKISLGFSKRYARLVLNKSRYLILGNINNLLTLRGEILVIGIFFGNTVVGIYSAAKKLIEPFTLIPFSIITIYYPTLIKKIGEINTKKFRRLAKYLILISSIISSTIFIFRNYLIDFFLGDTYKESATLISILAWSLILITLVQIRGKYLIAINNSNIYKYYVLSSIFIMLLGLVFFTSIYGIIGTAIGYITSLIISLFVLPLFINAKPWYYLK